MRFIIFKRTFVSSAMEITQIFIVVIFVCQIMEHSVLSPNFVSLIGESLKFIVICDSISKIIEEAVIAH